MIEFEGDISHVTRHLKRNVLSHMYYRLVVASSEDTSNFADKKVPLSIVNSIELYDANPTKNSLSNQAIFC